MYILFLPRPGRREINRTKHKEYLIVNCPYVYTVVEPISYFRLKVRRSRKGGGLSFLPQLWAHFARLHPRWCSLRRFEGSTLFKFFFFEIAWKLLERHCFLKSISSSFWGLRSFKNWLLQNYIFFLLRLAVTIHPFILQPWFLQFLEIWFEKSGWRNLVGEIWFEKSGSRNLVQEKWLCKLRFFSSGQPLSSNLKKS